MTSLPSLFDVRRERTQSDFATIARVVHSFCTGGHPFSAEQVRNALPPDLQARLAASPNVLGQVFTQLLASEMLVETGERVRAERKEARGRKLPLYIGNPRRAY